jgi:hypothetical protein
MDSADREVEAAGDELPDDTPAHPNPTRQRAEVARRDITEESLTRGMFDLTSESAEVE